MLFLGLLAPALVLASVVPQIPSQTLGDPQPWLALQSGPLASATSLVRVLGLYNVYRAFWFRLLLALTGLALFVWLLDSVDLAWRLTRRKPLKPAAFAHWGSAAPEVRVRSSWEPEEVTMRLRDVLGGWGYRWTNVPDLPVPNFVAVRRGGLLWLRPVALAALLLALVGLSAMGVWGWQGSEWQPAPGDVLSVGHSTPYQIRLDSYQPASAAGGHVCDYRSQVTWLAGEEALAQASVATGAPAVFHGVVLRQIGYVPAVQLRVWDEDGRPIGLQLAGTERTVPGRLDITFPSPEARPLILVPTRDLVLSLTFRAFGNKGSPELEVAMLRAGATQSQRIGALSGSGSLTAAGLKMDVNVNYRPVLQTGSRPAAGLVLGGLSVALIALAVGWFVPGRLLWIAVVADQDDTLIRLLALPGQGRRPWLPHLAARLRGMLSDES